MIESKLKAKNYNRGQLFRPLWASSARVMVVITDETQIEIFADKKKCHMICG